MRYSVPLFALALTAVADPSATLKRANAVKRDLTTVTSVLAEVDSLTGKLDTAVTGYSGDFSSIQSAGDAVIAAVKKGITAVTGSAQLTLTDALGVQAPVQKLTATVNQTVTDTIAKKSTFVSSNHGADVLKTLQDQKAGADQLSKAISSKVPASLADLATTLSAGISDALQNGITAFQDQAGKSSGGSSSAPSSASSGTSPSAASSGSSAPASSAAASAPSASSASSSSSSSGSTDSSSSGSSAASPSSPATTSSPAQFTGAGSVNGFSVVGLLAAVAVVLAF